MINVVLYEPEIPTNTGNIIRTCAAFKINLHLIEPLGFKMDEKNLKRAGMDYFDLCNINIHKNWEFFKNTIEKDSKFYFFTRYALKTVKECKFDFKNDIYLVFGKESTGIDKSILKNNLDNCYRFPMHENARSLNLSNCVAIAAYKAIEQNDFKDLSLNEVLKGKFFLLDK